MTPDYFFTPLKGQSLLYPGSDEEYRGQCTQSARLWIKQEGVNPPAYGSAYLFYDNGVPGFTKIPRGQPIKTGDLVVYSKAFGGNGHIDVASSDGTITDYWGWDSNWNPLLKLNKVHHNGSDNQYIVGYLRKEGEEMRIPTDIEIIDAKKFITGDPNYQPTGPEFDYYKQLEDGVPVHGDHQLMYDIIGGGNVRIEQAKQSSVKAIKLEKGFYEV